MKSNLEHTDILVDAYFTYTEVANLQWADPDHKYINCTVKFDQFPTSIPYTACKEDITKHCVEIYQRALDGDFGPIKEYEPPVLV